ncbi:MAG: methylmalonyl Co-A mutase-associated GTPase MeaB [Candidatus Neomarinimicrobiota bacterium]
MEDQLLNGIRANNHRTIARVISQIENDYEFPASFFADLYSASKKALRIGLTGPPGAGKSTLTNQLIQTLINDGKSVGVVAVDPTSPFTGGALLGDRVRMNQYIWNDAVYIRSMGSGGDLGGLARKAQEVGDVLAASGKDVVIFETVGVGQGEYDVAKAVDVTIVILVPESGDEIQLMKAGLIEIADIFVINKSDREGAGRLAHLLKNMLHSSQDQEKVEPAVFSTVARNGEGIDALYRGIADFVHTQRTNNRLKRRRLEHHRDRVLALIRDRLARDFWTKARLEKLDLAINDPDTIKSSPYQLAQDFLNSNADG